MYHGDERGREGAIEGQIMVVDTTRIRHKINLNEKWMFSKL
jgi:hypothetical protein